MSPPRLNAGERPLLCGADLTTGGSAKTFIAAKFDLSHIEAAPIHWPSCASWKRETPLDENNMPHAEYFEAVGRGVAAWIVVEHQLTSLFERLLICAFNVKLIEASFEHHWIIGNILNSITNVNTRLDLVDTTFNRLVKDEDIRTEWNSLKNKIKENYKRRNALAHGASWGNEAGISNLGSPMFSSRQQNYTPEQVKSWQGSFEALAVRIENFALRVNHYMNDNPLLVIPRG